MASSGCEDHAGQEGETFLYFAYGSNLLTERIHLRNPSAVFCCVARLQDFKLDFGNFQGKTSERWHGGIATIFQSPGDEVWGVVWRMNKSNLSSLDEQEGVKSGVYVVIEIKVSTQEGKEITCRSYLMTNYESSPPSPQYKKFCEWASHFGSSIFSTLQKIWNGDKISAIKGGQEVLECEVVTAVRSPADIF
ncbi:Gamma-glutamylcyclotransferase [Microtus ochrogaster]|uniref:Gamma-glutamylcyclotransferase n=1 Tax=Microtus ochrogaster TaxID=79684 RepID=A0A8J6GGB7_MICOH|nr:Gamma-glutamylcyclotransferase [Microtus ochrogaster]